jgi:hypothetical protein
MVYEWLIGKDVEVSGRGLIEVVHRRFLGETEKNDEPRSG